MVSEYRLKVELKNQLVVLPDADIEMSAKVLIAGFRFMLMLRAAKEVFGAVDHLI